MTDATGDDPAAVPPRHPARVKSSAAAPPTSSSQAAAEKRSGIVKATAAPVAPALADFNARQARKLGSGRAGIDARLDLHGLRQDEALARLRHFLRDAHGRGLKTVLVITGKGRDPDDPSLTYADTLERQPRGVLRRNLPRWLDDPELRAIVVSYTTAAQRHGGDGAVYVELRRKHRSAP